MFLRAVKSVILVPRFAIYDDESRKYGLKPYLSNTLIIRVKRWESNGQYLPSTPTSRQISVAILIAVDVIQANKSTALNDGHTSFAF